MSVAQFGEHVAEYFEQLILCHSVVDSRAIFVIYVVPGQTTLCGLVVMEAVLCVDDAPQLLKIVGRRVVRKLFPYATVAEHGGQYKVEKQLDEAFHAVSFKEGYRTKERCCGSLRLIKLKCFT